MGWFKPKLKRIIVDIYPFGVRDIQWNGDINIGNNIYTGFRWRAMTAAEVVEKFGPNHRPVGSVENGAIFFPRTPIRTVAEAEKVAIETVTRKISSNPEIYAEPEIRVWYDYNEYVLEKVRRRHRPKALQ